MKGDMVFKKNDKVKWKVGRAKKANKGRVLQRVTAGTIFGDVRGFARITSTLEEGDEVQHDSFVVEDGDGVRRLIGSGYLQGA